MESEAQSVLFGLKEELIDVKEELVDLEEMCCLKKSVEDLLGRVDWDFNPNQDLGQDNSGLG